MIFHNMVFTMRYRVFLCLMAAAPALQGQAPLEPLPKAAEREASREEMQQRIGELSAFAATCGPRSDAMRRELAESEMAMWDRGRARNLEIAELRKKSGADDEAAAMRIASLQEENAADEAAWRRKAAELKSQQTAFQEKLIPWNLEFEVAAGSVLKGEAMLESGAGLTSIKARLQSGTLVYRWQGTDPGGQPELEIELVFRPLPPGVAAHFGNPTRKIGGTGTVMMAKESVAAVAFEKFLIEVKLDHWEEGGKPRLKSPRK